jgi:glucosamine kinase
VSAVLAVDGGQTALRMALVEGGRPGRPVEVGGYSHASAAGYEGIAAAVAEARGKLGVRGAVRRICLGLTGAPEPPELRARLASLVSRALGDAEVWLGPDMVIAHAGALGLAPGVVVAAGTGTVVLGLAEDGTAHRADGLGYMLGDDGSGFAVGRAGLRCALRAREGRGPATALEAAADRFFGGLQGLPHHIYGSVTAVSEVASFAPEVARVARDGDELAVSIWREAATQLVASVAAVVRRTFPDAPAGSVAVSYAGRLFQVEDLLLEPFRSGLAERCPAASLRPPQGDGLAGAAALAAHGLGRYAPLMHTTRGAQS